MKNSVQRTLDEGRKKRRMSSFAGTTLTVE